MNYSQPHRYKIFFLDYWNSDAMADLNYVYMSAIPSKEDILLVLRNQGQLDGLSLEYVDSLQIKRPEGWHYKVIEIYDGNQTCVWKIKPTP